jgi:hypothetical protein
MTAFVRCLSFQRALREPAIVAACAASMRTGLVVPAARASAVEGWPAMPSGG